ncbi:MAG: hypothetical protein QGH20_02610 [Candidatus Latescibacteria bacterium]|jgi:hypothetical protein|nr:hypothetical protein [Candidatus Latescibacterota bacterium]
MTAAMRFGAACSWADVPVTDLYYSINQIEKNDRFNEGIESSDGWPVPVIHVVRQIVDHTRNALDDTQQEWWNHSVNPYLPLIRQPMVATWSTADLLVPPNPLSDEYVRPFGHKVFPNGYSLDYSQLGNELSGGKTLVDLLSEDETEIFLVETPGDAPRTPRLPPLEADADKEPDPNAPKPPMQTTPWSKDRRFSIVVWDEGPPNPLCGH